MERDTVGRLKQLFGNGFVGPEELLPFMNRLGVTDPISPLPFNYNIEELESYSKDYLLIMGLPRIGRHVMTIRALRDIFGIDPDINEPCFYNQDWYLNEKFIDQPLDARWYLLRRQVVESSRAVMPDDLIRQQMKFPSAIDCVYAFFAYYFLTGECLWYHDFIWCSDKDHNGDRIYVGKYHDVDGVNKNGFSIHRHLALRNCYAAVDII